MNAQSRFCTSKSLRVKIPNVTTMVFHSKPFSEDNDKLVGGFNPFEKY